MAIRIRRRDKKAGSGKLLTCKALVWHAPLAKRRVMRLKGQRSSSYADRPNYSSLR